MPAYNCFMCEKSIKVEYAKKKVRCPYCGSKIIYKPRTVNAKVKAI